MAEELLPPAPAPTTEYCYRHPQTATAVHCTRCGRPICTECMIPAPVGFQCPQCVEDARRAFRRGSSTALGGGPIVTKVLLASILSVFVLELAVGGAGSLLEGPNARQLVDLGALQPLLVAHGQFWRLFSAMFLHLGLMHIAFNAYALWLIGQMVEREFGHTEMAVIYLVSGFLASVASYVFGPVTSVGVGASGAIFGIFGAFIAYNFKRRHLELASANLRWAATLLLLNLFLALAFHGIDWRAHLGGLVAGLACGVVAEGWGTASQRRMVQVLGFASLIAIGIGLVLWRTDAIQALPIYQQIFG